jgi:hypothetical protein
MAGHRSVLILLCTAGILTAGATSAPSGGRELTANCELHGSLTVRGTAAAIGTRVEAYTGGTLLADTTVRTRGYYEILILSDDPVTLEKDGWALNDVITIAVDGETAQPTVLAFEGHDQVDLSVQLTSDVRRSTWGKIKALFR